jgi:hypothetical protein
MTQNSTQPLTYMATNISGYTFTGTNTAEFNDFLVGKFDKNSTSITCGEIVNPNYNNHLIIKQKATGYSVDGKCFSNEVDFLKHVNERPHNLKRNWLNPLLQNF